MVKVMPARRAGWLAAAGLLFGLSAPALGNCPTPLDMRILPPEARPAAHPWPEWTNLANGLSARLATMDLSAINLVFIGDSLVSEWTPDIFEQFYGSRRALNLGVPGDTTQSLLWRIQRGNWPAALRPRVVVLLVGTNNAEFGWPPDITAQAIMRVVEELKVKAPGARILLVGLLPRGAERTAPPRAINRRVNSLLEACQDGRTLFWADADRLLLDINQRLTPLISHDQTHLTPFGYTILSTVMEPVLRAALNEERGAGRR